MTTGVRPFDVEGVDKLMRQHLKVMAQPPQKVNPNISDGLNAIIRKLLLKTPAKRYQNARELLDEMSRYRRGEAPLALQQLGHQIRCTFCEAMNPSSEQNCKVCGETLHPSAQEITLLPREDEIQCPACRGFVKKDARHCPSCNKPICVRCHKRIATLRGYCPACMPHLHRRG